MYSAILGSDGSEHIADSVDAAITHIVGKGAHGVVMLGGTVICRVSCTVQPVNIFFDEVDYAGICLPFDATIESRSKKGATVYFKNCSFGESGIIDV
jgi:hypothetical protein